MRSYKTTEPHNYAFPTSCRRLRKALDQVAEYCSPRCAVKEHNFLHGKRSAKHGLINVGHPEALRLIAQFSIEVQLLLLPSKTWSCVEARVRPAVLPLGQKKVM